VFGNRFFLCVKQTGCQCSAKVKNEWKCSLTLFHQMRWWHGQGNLSLYLAVLSNNIINPLSFTMCNVYEIFPERCFQVLPVWNSRCAVRHISFKFQNKIWQQMSQIFWYLHRQAIWQKEVTLPLHTQSDSYGFVNVSSYVCSTSTADENNLSASRSSRLTPLKESYVTPYCSIVSSRNGSITIGDYEIFKQFWQNDVYVKSNLGLS
jgi:hypothetical protein